MTHPVALITPSHRKDLERFALLAESVDRYVTGFERHYVIVNDDDAALFAPYAGDRRVILPASQFLPRWLWAVPRAFSRRGRRVWWSFRSGPVHGWHIQQLIKIAASMELPQARFAMIDSDNVFFRPFDIGAHAGGEKAPLYVERGAIAAEAPLHGVWTRAADALLGRGEASFPADDFIGNVIVWDRAAVRDMTRAIEAATGGNWQAALCRTRQFSEYILYGRFVAGSPVHAATHEATEEGLAEAHWDADALDAANVNAMVAQAPESKVALCIESFSNTSVEIIREAVGLAAAA